MLVVHLDCKITQIIRRIIIFEKKRADFWLHACLYVDKKGLLIMLVAENKSEEKDIKLIVFYRKDDSPSLFRGKLFNFVPLLNYP